MKRHLLIAVSDDVSALIGVRFVANFVERQDLVRVTLFSTLPRGGAVWDEEKSYETITAQDQYLARSEARYSSARNESRRILVEHGFDGVEVDSKSTPRMFDRALDIVQESERGLYDAVVLGRRGVAGLMEMVDESVSKHVMLRETGCPIWVCRNAAQDKRNILLCVDGSEPSFRMADHVGFMHDMSPSQRVVLFQVLRPDTGKGAVEDNFVRARNQLLRNGVSPDMILTRVEQSKDVAGAVLAEAERGQYAVVAVGRTGAGQSGLQRLFAGSVSMKLMHELTGSVLWFCR